MVPRTVSVPAFFISPADLAADTTRISVRLSKSEYSEFSKWTRANKCGPPSGPPQDGILVTEHDNATTQMVCRMPWPAACRYLTGIADIPDIDWQDQKWDFLRHIANSFCK
jgi:hypothetical protein